MNLNNKTALISGASTGIGRAIALHLAEQGAHVFLVARTKHRLEETQRLITEAGGSADILVADLSNLSSVNIMIDQLKQKTETLDILANVAGIWHGDDEVYAGKDFETFEQKVIHDTFMVGTITPSVLAHAVIPLMKNGGKILNISGTFENGAKGWLPYYVSKRAIEDLTIGLAEELESKNIQVNAISPSDTATEEYRKYFPQFIGEAISPEEIAEHACFLCSAEADNVTGKVIVMKKDSQPFEGFHY